MNTGAGRPRSVLLALTLCVLAAHLWVLHGIPARVRMRAPAPVATFAMRRLEPPVALAAPMARDFVAATPQPAVKPRPGTPGAPPLRHDAAPGQPQARHVAASAPAPVAATPDVHPAPLRVPDPVELRYQVTARVRGREVQGTSELRWQHDGERYEAEFALAVPELPPRRQHSAGRLTGGGLQPQRYAEQGRGEQATHFDHEAQRLIFSNNRPAVGLTDGAQDRLSVLLQLSAMLSGAAQRYPAGATIAIQTATTREAGDWLFRVEGDESLPLPGGEITTIKLVRPPRGEYDLRMEIWLAPGAAYVPARLRLTQPNGDWVDHQWSTTDRR